MHLPDGIETMRGSEFLDVVATFASQWSEYYRGKSEEATRWADAFLALHHMALALKFSQRDHIERMARNRADGKRVFSETDMTVDTAISAARSAFIHGVKT